LTMSLRLPPIYPITDKKLSGRPTHLSILKELARGGARLVQIRDKDTPVADLLADLRRCVEFASKHDVRILVNDRCDLVLSSGAAGVHLGQQDLPPAAARTLLGPDRVIGYSTHSMREVEKSLDAPVDYIGFGPVFATTTKANPSRVVGLTRLKRVCHSSLRPVVAIGGIGLAQVRAVLDAGAASAAVISGLMCAKNLAGRMEEFLKRAMEKP
jgi:thiamine-phosphate pyrophosphorylase